MSENEKNLTPGERKLLNSLNTKANLILEFEEICRAQKIPFNKEYIYTLEEDDLRAIIHNFSPEGQAKIKKMIKYETKSEDQHIKNVFKLEERLGLLAQLVRAADS